MPWLTAGMTLVPSPMPMSTTPRPMSVIGTEEFERVIDVDLAAYVDKLASDGLFRRRMGLAARRSVAPSRARSSSPRSYFGSL